MPLFIIIAGAVFVAVLLVFLHVLNTRLPDSTLDIAWHLLPAALLIVATVIGAAWLLTRYLQRADPEWAAGGTITIDQHGRVTLHDKRLFRDPTPRATIDLDQVAALTWDVNIFNPSGTMYLRFWDHDPKLTLHVIGLIPTNLDSTPIGEISIPFLQRFPDAEQQLRSQLRSRIAQGSTTTNVDIQTWEPIGELLPPPERGISFEGRKILYRKPSGDDEL